jgi:geranylgeranylglycerol-phosphate geranylgeranyltransferase
MTTCSNSEPPSASESRPGALIALVRPVNGLIAAAGVAVGAFVVSRPTAWGAAALGAASALSAAAAANALNDVLDVEADRVNRPERPIPAGLIGRRPAVVLAIALYATAVGAAVPLGRGAVLLVLGWVALTALYSTVFKGVPVVGNVVVAAVSGSPLLMGGISQGTLRPLAAPFALAFLAHLAREAVKDVEDRRGDEAAGVRTLAVASGPGAGLALARIALVATMWLAVAPFALRLFGWGYLVLLVPIEAALAWLIVALGAGGHERTLKRSSAVLKAVMVAGLVAFAAGVY